MVAFGQALERLRREEWAAFYVDYEALKRVLGVAPWDFVASLLREIRCCALFALEETGRVAALVRRAIRIPRK